jgi:hypothetical protein
LNFCPISFSLRSSRNRGGTSDQFQTLGIRHQEILRNWFFSMLKLSLAHKKGWPESKVTSWAFPSWEPPGPRSRHPCRAVYAEVFFARTSFATRLISSMHSSSQIQERNSLDNRDRNLSGTGQDTINRFHLVLHNVQRTWEASQYVRLDPRCLRISSSFWQSWMMRRHLTHKQPGQ